MRRLTLLLPAAIAALAPIVLAQSTGPQDLKTWPSNGARTIAFDSKTGHLFCDGIGGRASAGGDATASRRPGRWPRRRNPELLHDHHGRPIGLEWINPPAHFQMEVTDPSGPTANWDIELGRAAGLLRNGWTRNSLKVGKVVAVTGYLARDGTKTANSSTVPVNGRRLFAGSSAGTEGANPPPPQ